MESYNYTVARAILGELMVKASYGYPIEITRKYREAVVLISKADYEDYQKLKFAEQYSSNCQDKISNY